MSCRRPVCLLILIFHFKADFAQEFAEEVGVEALDVGTVAVVLEVDVWAYGASGFVARAF